MRKLLASTIIAVTLQSVPSYAQEPPAQTRVSLESAWKGEISRGKDGKIVVKPYANMRVASKVSCETLESGAPAHIREIVHKNALDMGLDARLVMAMMYAESGYNHMAVSPKGAAGLLQLMPATARRFGVKDVFDPADNIKAGMTYMKWLLNEFKQDVSLMVAGYNAGEGAVNKYGGIPAYRETRNYVATVMQLHACQKSTVPVNIAVKTS